MMKNALGIKYNEVQNDYLPCDKYFMMSNSKVFFKLLTSYLIVPEYRFTFLNGVSLNAQGYFILTASNISEYWHLLSNSGSISRSVTPKSFTMTTWPFHKDISDTSQNFNARLKLIYQH